MTLQVFEDLIKGHETTKSTGSGAAVGTPSPSPSSTASSHHHESSSLSTPSSSSPNNSTRRSLLRGGLAGLRRNLPPLSSLMEDILSKSESFASSSEHDPSTSEHDWMELLRHRTEQDVKVLIEGEAEEFRSFQEHVRYQLHMTDSVIKHNLYQLVRAHQLATEWKKHHSKRPSPSHFLPALSIYENEFTAVSSTSSTPLTSSQGRVVAVSSKNEEENKVEEDDSDIQRETSTSSPQSVVMNVVQWSSNDVRKHSIATLLDETSNPNACEEKECR